MVSRQNDIIKALTHKLADGAETAKNFRITNHHVNNLESFLSEQLQNGKLDSLSPERVPPIRGSHGNYRPEGAPNLKFGEFATINVV